MKNTNRLLVYLLLTLCLANPAVSQSQDDCPTCAYVSESINGTQQPGKDCVCVKLGFTPAVRVCTAPATSGYECFSNQTPTKVLVANYLAVCPDCKDCATADYTYMGSSNRDVYECYTDDTYCGGNG